MSALRPAFFILYLESYISRLNEILCHDLTLSVSEPDNAAAQTGAGTSFGANGDQHTRAVELSTYFCALTIRKHLSKVDFERSGRGQEPSRGHKLSILENVVLHRDFTSQTLASFPSDLVGVALVRATPLHLLSQTALPLKSPTGAFIAALRIRGLCVLSAAVEGKNRPVATNFQFLKISCPSGTSLLKLLRVF